MVESIINSVYSLPQILQSIQQKDILMIDCLDNIKKEIIKKVEKHELEFSSHPKWTGDYHIYLFHRLMSKDNDYVLNKRFQLFNVLRSIF